MNKFIEVLPTLDDIITQAVNNRLEKFKGNQSRAALSLGMSRGCFRKYMTVKVIKNVVYETSLRDTVEL